MVELRKARALIKNDRLLAEKCERILAATERQESLAPRLSAVLAGKGEPRDSAEALGFAQLCYEQKLYGTSARFWAEAFRSQPDLAGDMQAHHRCNAVCAAALAGCGQGKDATTLSDETKAHWRKQALDWFEINLKACSKLLRSGRPELRAFALQELQHWKADADLTGLRDHAALAKLSTDEQTRCRELWSEVDALLADRSRPQ
jgi:hypothetical protein